MWSNLKWPDILAAVLRAALFALLGALGDGVVTGGRLAAVGARAVGAP